MAEAAAVTARRADPQAVHTRAAARATALPVTPSNNKLHSIADKGRYHDTKLTVKASKSLLPFVVSVHCSQEIEIKDEKKNVRNVTTRKKTAK